MSINVRDFATCVAMSACLSTAAALADTAGHSEQNRHSERSEESVIVSEAGDTAIYVPDQYSRDRRWPLVILLHGAGATGDMQDLHLGISERVSAKGMILAVPEARVAGSGSSADFLLGLITSVKQQYQIDDQRVFLIGHSMGGYQSLRFACEHGDVISGMVISAAAGTCTSGTGSVRLLLATGDADVSDANVGATVSSWRRVNRCTEAYDSTNGYDLHWDIAGPESTLTSWGDCESGEPVASMRSQFGRHIPVFKGEFADAALDFLLNGSVRQPSPVRPACLAEGNDRGHYVKHTFSTAGQRSALSVQQFGDNRCTQLLSTVVFSGPAAQVTAGRSVDTVYPLRFDTVSATAHDSAVAQDLTAAQLQETSLCNLAWEQGTDYALSGRDAAARRACLTSVGNISGPASFIKKLVLSYLFSPALP
jgi:poly(3-hydroxybutyrate) depolymerase